MGELNEVYHKMCVCVLVRSVESGVMLIARWFQTKPGCTQKSAENKSNNLPIMQFWHQTIWNSPGRQAATLLTAFPPPALSAAHFHPLTRPRNSDMQTWEQWGWPKHSRWGEERGGGKHTCRGHLTSRKTCLLLWLILKISDLPVHLEIRKSVQGQGRRKWVRPVPLYSDTLPCSQQEWLLHLRESRCTFLTLFQVASLSGVWRIYRKDKVEGSQVPCLLQTQVLTEDRRRRGQRAKGREGGVGGGRGGRGRREATVAPTAEVETVNESFPPVSLLCTKRGSVFLQVNLACSHSCTASEFLVQPDVQLPNPQSYWRVGPFCLAKSLRWPGQLESRQFSREKCKRFPLSITYFPQVSNSIFLLCILEELWTSTHPLPRVLNWNQ